jgi:hypothetical protein
VRRKKTNAAAGGGGFTDGQHIAVIAMSRDHAVVEREAVGIESQLVDVSVAGISAGIVGERVYIAYPDEKQATAAAVYAAPLLARFRVEFGLVLEAMRPSDMARIFAKSRVVIGSKLAFDIAKLNTRNGGRHGYIQPDGWVLPEVDFTLIDRANQRTVLTEQPRDERTPGRVIDALTVMDLIADAWRTGSTASVGGEQDQTHFANLGKTVVMVAPDQPRVAKDYLAQFDTVDQAWNFAARHAQEAHGFPVVFGAASASAAASFSARLHAAGVTHDVLTAENIGRSSDILAHAGRRGAVTVVGVPLRGQDIEIDGDLNAEGGGLHTIVLSPAPTLRHEIHARALSGRRGTHGESWVLSFPQEAPATGYSEPDIFITLA